MGIFFPKGIKAIADKNKVAMSYFVTCACFLLIACNVAVFLFIPKIMLPLAVILSNAITVLLMLLAVRPINALLQREFAKKAEQLQEEQKEEQALRDRVKELENRNNELERRMDTWAQTASVPSNVNLSFKLETMTYDKSGYIVKEEPLDRFLEDPSYKLADKKGILDKLTQWMALVQVSRKLTSPSFQASKSRLRVGSKSRLISAGSPSSLKLMLSGQSSLKLPWRGR